MPETLTCRYCETRIEYLELTISNERRHIREGTCNLYGEDDDIEREYDNETNEIRTYRCPECNRIINIDDDDLYENNDYYDDDDDDDNDDDDNDDNDNNDDDNIIQESNRENRRRIINRIEDIQIKVKQCPKCGTLNNIPEDNQEEIIFCSNNDCNEEIYLK